MLLNCFLPWGGRWAPAWEWTASELPAWEANKLLPSPEGRWVPAWEAWDATKLLPSWGGRWASAWEWTASELPAWEANKLLPSPEGRWVPAWEAWDATKLLPSLGGGEHLPRNELLVSCLPRKLINCFLPQREGECLPEMPLYCFLPWGGRWARTWEWTASELPAWEANRLPPSPEGRSMHACLWIASFPGGKVSTFLPACLGRN